MVHDGPDQSPQMRPSHIESLEELAVPAALMAVSGLTLETNMAYCEAFGLDPSELLGSVIYDRVGAQIGTSIRYIFAKLTTAAPTLSTPAILQTLHGRARRRIWQFTGLFDEAGRLQSVLALFWDVTEEYRYNETLEELIRITNDRALDTDDVVKGILAIGHAYFDMTAGVISRYAEDGIHAEFQVWQDSSKCEEFLPHGLTYTSITHSKGSIVAIKDIEQTQYAQDDFHKRLNMRSFLSAEIYVDGALYGALSFASPEPRDRPFGNEDIQLIRILVQWLSYALLRRRKVAELKANEEKYRFIYQNSPIMMHTVDEDLKLRDVNKMWLDTLGYSHEEVIGTPLVDHLLEPSKKAALAAASRIAEEPLRNAPRTMVRADGTVVEVESSTLLEPDSGAPGVLTVLNNVTDRNRAQRSLARLNEGLRRTNEGLKRFNAIAAHDLQEPLRKIRLFSDVLHDALSDLDDPRIGEPLTIIHRSADRLSKLVSDLQTYTRDTQRGLHRIPVDLNRLLAEVLEQRAPEPEIRVEIGPLPHVTGDPDSLTKLFNNLLTSALAGHHKAHPGEIRLFAEIGEAGGARITLRDNGDSLPKSKTDKIFEPFARMRKQDGQEEDNGDSGIGLAIAKSIVEGHGWTIHAGPNPEGAGSDFIIDIPAHQIIHRHVRG